MEQRNIKNTRNDYYQILSVNQLQLNEINEHFSVVEELLNKNLLNGASKTTQLIKR